MTKTETKLQIATAGTKLTHFTRDGETTSCGRKVAEILDRDVLYVSHWRGRSVLEAANCRHCSQHGSTPEIRRRLREYNMKHNAINSSHECSPECETDF